MSKVVFNSHDLLGKLSIVKNYLAMLDKGNPDQAKSVEYLDRCRTTIDELIAWVKEGVNGKNFDG